MHPEPDQAKPPYAVLTQMCLGSWVSAAISVTARLAIADHLESGPKTTRELAEQLNVHEGSLYRLLRALASVGIFQEGEGRVFSQTALSAPLSANARPCLRHAAMMTWDEWQVRNWAELGWSIQTGRPAIEKAHGMTLFQYFSKHPEQSVTFNNAMTDLSTGDAAAVLASYDFSAFEHIVDVGGGLGLLLAAILEIAPSARGTLFDLPHVIEQAQKAATLSQLGDRCRFAQGSFFDGVPGGADAYLMKHVIHDWDHEHAVQILSICRKAVRRGGKVLVVDRLIGPPNKPDLAKLSDLAMLVSAGGRERDDTEWRGLFTASGLRLERIIPMPTQQSILEAALA